MRIVPCVAHVAKVHISKQLRQIDALISKNYYVGSPHNVYNFHFFVYFEIKQTKMLMEIVDYCLSSFISKFLFPSINFLYQYIQAVQRANPASTFLILQLPALNNPYCAFRVVFCLSCDWFYVRQTVFCCLQTVKGRI